MLTRENPAYVGIEESLVAWRVDIVLGVRMQVMMAVLGGPPENAFLRRALGEKGEDELESPAGAVSAMREVTVVARTDGEHAKPVEGDPDPNGCTCHTRPDRPEAGEVNEDERHAFRVEDVVLMRRLKAGVGCSHNLCSFLQKPCQGLGCTLIDANGFKIGQVPLMRSQGPARI